MRPKIGELRLHDPKRARFLVTNAKTETGIREVEMSPELVAVILAHIDRLRRYGRSITPEDYVFQNNKGRRMSRRSIGKILTEAAVAASETLSAGGICPRCHT